MIKERRTGNGDWAIIEISGPRGTIEIHHNGAECFAPNTPAGECPEDIDAAREWARGRVDDRPHVHMWRQGDTWAVEAPDGTEEPPISFFAAIPQDSDKAEAARMGGLLGARSVSVYSEDCRKVVHRWTA